MYILSQQIKLMRIRKGWSQKRLAAKTALSQSTICRMEIDCSNVQIGYLFRVFMALNAFENDLANAKANILENYFLTFLGLKRQIFFNNLKLTATQKTLLTTCLELMESVNLLLLK